MVGDAEHFVHGIVVETSDAGGASAGRFGFEVQHLSDEAGLPEEMPVEGRPKRVEAGVELRDHAEAEEPVGGDRLIAADAFGEAAAVAERELKERHGI